MNQEKFRITLLGTGNPNPHMTGYQTGVLVEAGESRFLFDTGRGTVLRLREIKKFGNIHHVFLTHLHSDHVVALPDFWLSRFLCYRKSIPLSILGPEGTEAMCFHMEKAFSDDIKFRTEDAGLDPVRAKICSKNIEEDFVFNYQGVKISSFFVDHSPVKPSLGYKVEFNNYSVVLSGDTRYSENLIKHAHKVDVLIHEVAYLTEGISDCEKEINNRQAHHTHPIEAGKIFQKVNPRLAVYYHIALGKEKTFGDLYLKTKTQYQGNLILGKDLMYIDIGTKINIKP